MAAFVCGAPLELTLVFPTAADDSGITASAVRFAVAAKLAVEQERVQVCRIRRE